MPKFSLVQLLALFKTEDLILYDIVNSMKKTRDIIELTRLENMARAVGKGKLYSTRTNIEQAIELIRSQNPIIKVSVVKATKTRKETIEKVIIAKATIAKEDPTGKVTAAIVTAESKSILSSSLPLQRATAVQLAEAEINAAVTLWTKRGLRDVQKRLSQLKIELKNKISEYNKIDSDIASLGTVGELYSPKQTLSEIINDPTILSYMINSLLDNYYSAASSIEDLNLPEFNSSLERAVIAQASKIFVIDIKEVESKNSKEDVDQLTKIRDKIKIKYPSQMGSEKELSGRTFKNTVFDIFVGIDLQSTLGGGNELGAGIKAGRGISLGEPPAWAKASVKPTDGRKASNLWKHRLYLPARLGIAYVRRKKLPLGNGKTLHKLRKERSGSNTITNENTKLVKLYWDIIRARTSKWSSMGKAPWWMLVEYGNAIVSGNAIPGGNSDPTQKMRIAFNSSYSANKSGFPTPIWSPRPFIEKTKREISAKLKSILATKLETLHEKSGIVEQRKNNPPRRQKLQDIINKIDTDILLLTKVSEMVPKISEVDETLALVLSDITQLVNEKLVIILEGGSATALRGYKDSGRNIDRLINRVITGEDIPKNKRIFITRVTERNNKRIEINVKQILKEISSIIDKRITEVSGEAEKDKIKVRVINKSKNTLLWIKEVIRRKRAAIFKLRLAAKNLPVTTTPAQVENIIKGEVDNILINLLVKTPLPIEPE